MAAVKGVAIDLTRELAEVLESGSDLHVQFLGRIHAPAFDPLGAGQPPAGVLTLAAAAAGAAPGGLVGL
jgi:hypothetical protein